MKIKHFIAVASSLFLSLPAWSSGIDCFQLADIGQKAYQAKQEGQSLTKIISAIDYILKDDPRKNQLAQGVVIAIYGDNSIKSSSEAFSITYNACPK